MRYEITIEDADVAELSQKLQAFQDSGIDGPMEKGARALLSRLRKNVEEGRDINGASYPDVKEITKIMEIKGAGEFFDPRIRGDVSSNPKAMNVTGESSDSLSYTKVKPLEYEVGFDGNRASAVFESNARNFGNSNKPKRDPLGLSESSVPDEELDAVAELIEKAIDRLVNGF